MTRMRERRRRGSPMRKMSIGGSRSTWYGRALSRGKGKHLNLQGKFLPIGVPQNEEMSLGGPRNKVLSRLDLPVKASICFPVYSTLLSSTIRCRREGVIDVQ